MTVFGNDVSIYQTGLKVSALKALSAEFLIARVTYGGSGVDKEYTRFKTEAEQQQMLFSAYHFVYNSDPVAQAKNIVAHLGDKSIPVMLDLEPSGSGGQPHLPVAGLVRRNLHNMGVRATLLYYPHWYWLATGSPSLKGWDLAASAYPSSAKASPKALYGGDNHKDWTPYGGVSPTIWQYASTGVVPGYTGNTVDCDAYRGSRDLLAQTGLFKDYAPHPVVSKPRPTAPIARPHAEAIIAEAKAGIAGNNGAPAQQAKFRQILSIATDLLND